MKKYGKRKVPRTIHEFEDLVVPYYENKEYDRVNDLLLSFWKRKGKSSRTAFFINAGLISSSFKGEIKLNAKHLLDTFFIIPSDAFVLDNKWDFHSYLNDAFLTEFKSSYNFLRKFYKNIDWDPPTDLVEYFYTRDYYEELASVELKYNKSWIYGQEHNRIDIQARAFIEFELRKIVAKATKLFREESGLSPIGAKWRNEQLLLDRIKAKFEKEVVLGQGSPMWLKGQRFDIWLPEHDLAIEYNGIQHYQPVNFFGGEEGFKAVQKRDQEKRRKCKENNVKLLEVKENYNFSNIEKWITEFLKPKPN